MEIVSSKFFIIVELFKNILILLITWSFLFFLKYKIKFSNQTLIFFILSSFFPFFITNFFFDPSYMWDLIAYQKNINFLRNLEFLLVKPETVSSYTFSILYAIFPLPFLDNILRVGFVSKIIFFFFLIYLIHIKHIKENSLIFLFIIFWPSTILYSSIGLREMLIAIICYLIFFALIEKKLFIWILAMSITLLIKPQNFYILILTSIFFYCIFIIKAKFSYLISILSIAFYLIFYFFSVDILEKLNFYKKNLYEEDDNLDNYLDIVFDNNFIFLFINSAVNFLLSPTPNIITNTFRMFQFLENILVLFLIFVLGFQSYKINKRLVIFIFFTLLLYSAIYGLVSSNSGSIARWRYPIFFTTILLLNFIKVKGKNP